MGERVEYAKHLRAQHLQSMSLLRAITFAEKPFMSKSGNKRLKAHKLGAKTLIFAEDEAAWRNNLPVLELGSAA